jgi:hypothetical protein
MTLSSGSHGPRHTVGYVGRAAALFAVLTIILAYPLSIRPGSTVVVDAPDTHLFIWTLAWDAHAFATQPLSIFDANMYYPERLTLAYSENLIGSAFIAAPVLWLTGNSVLALNTVALLSCFLCGLGAYVLGRRAGLSYEGAVLCGIVFAFSPPRFFRITQLFLTTVQWIPFTLASLHAYFDSGERRHLRWAAAFGSLQVLSSGHGAVFVGFAAALFTIWRCFLGTAFNPARWIRDLGIVGGALLAPAILIFVPYRIVQVEMGLRRTLENWAATPESFLASPSRLHTALLEHIGPRVNETASAFLFPGYFPVLLAIAAAWWYRDSMSPPLLRVLRRLAPLVTFAACAALVLAAIVTLSGPVRIRAGTVVLFSAKTPLRAWLLFVSLAAARAVLARWIPFEPWARALAWRRSLVATPYPRSIAAFYLFLTIGCVLLAAGPPISVWPLVYWLPGFNFIRGPSRFMILGVLGFAVLAGIGFERLSSRAVAARARAIAAMLVGAAMLLEFGAFPLGTVPYAVSIPPADQWLALQPKPFVVAEVPVGGERLQTAYILHSMAHWQKTVQGYSGIRPALHEELYSMLRHFPDAQSIQRLQQLGVNYVVVHSEWYPPDQWPAVEDRLKAFAAQLRLTHSARGGMVYELRREGGGAGGAR